MRSIAQSWLTLCDPRVYSPPNWSVYGILQAIILEWVAISFSRGSSWRRDWSRVSCFGRCILYQSHLGSPISFLYSTCKWYHIFVLLCPACFTMMTSVSIHVAENDTISFLWLSKIPLYVCASPFSIHLFMDTEVTSTSCLLWTVLLWTLRCMDLFE